LQASGERINQYLQYFPVLIITVPAQENSGINIRSLREADIFLSPDQYLEANKAPRRLRGTMK
jgi:hypothetical protein